MTLCNRANSELFYTVIDMLSVLVLSTLITDGQEKVEDNRKVYHNLIKKLKVGSCLCLMVGEFSGSTDLFHCSLMLCLHDLVRFLWVALWYT